MEQTFAIRFSRRALHDIDLIEHYITSQGYPEVAFAYIARILAYIKTLPYLPFKTTICKHPTFAKRDFRCAVFEKTYVIVYRTKFDTIEILRVIHGRRLNF